MKVKNKEKVINLTLAVLDGLLRIGQISKSAFVDQKSFFKTLHEEYPSQKISDRVSQMLRSGYIEVTEENGSKSIRITRKGEIKRLEKTNDLTTDGKWRFLSFDIPEGRSVARHKLVRSLHRINFKAVQKSLWVTPYVKADEIDFIFEELDIRPYCAYFIVEKTDIDDHLHRLFPEVS
jgi:DNA-binding transcriptional regulator PaaX